MGNASDLNLLMSFPKVSPHTREQTLQPHTGNNDMEYKRKYCSMSADDYLTWHPLSHLDGQSFMLSYRCRTLVYSHYAGRWRICNVCGVVCALKERKDNLCSRSNSCVIPVTFLYVTGNTYWHQTKTVSCIFMMSLFNVTVSCVSLITARWLPLHILILILKPPPGQPKLSMTVNLTTWGLYRGLFSVGSPACHHLLVMMMKRLWRMLERRSLITKMKPLTMSLIWPRTSSANCLSRKLSKWLKIIYIVLKRLYDCRRVTGPLWDPQWLKELDFICLGGETCLFIVVVLLTYIWSPIILKSCDFVSHRTMLTATMYSVASILYHHNAA